MRLLTLCVTILSALYLVMAWLWVKRSCSVWMDPMSTNRSRGSWWWHQGPWWWWASRHWLLYPPYCSQCVQSRLSSRQQGLYLELVINVYYWFKNFPAHIEDYDALYSALSDDWRCHQFWLFALFDIRWLSLGPVTDRVLEHFAILRDFFIKGKFEMATKENARFTSICSHMKANEVTLAGLHTFRPFVLISNVSLNFFRNLLHSFICGVTSWQKYCVSLCFVLSKSTWLKVNQPSLLWS